MRKNNPFFSLSLGLNRKTDLLLMTISMTLAIFISPLQAGVETDKQPSIIRQNNLQKLINNGAYGITKDGKMLYSTNLDVPLVPASIIKLLTGLLAFDQLGLNYQFKTEFFVDIDANLYIKGHGDPFLVSEEIEEIMASLKKSGIKNINNIYIDSSNYQLESIADGTGNSLNPYDAASSALAVNFNTINILIDKNGSVRSGEPQTPLLPIMTRLGKNLTPGEHRINVSEDPIDSLLLAGELFRSFQQKTGIKGKGLIARHKAPDSKLVLTHFSSKQLSELVAGLMLYSNNFIANQIFLQIGAEKFGYPATWQKAQQAMLDFIKEDHILDPTSNKLVEGSGLSRKNRLTIRAILRILEMFKSYAHLLPEKNGILLKSGTLTGVYSYAGYFVDNGVLDSFAIILNQNNNSRDKILNTLRDIYNSTPLDQKVSYSANQ